MDEQTEEIISGRTADLLGLADVSRWGVVKTLRPQSVAEHSFAVAVIAMVLAERLFQGKVEDMAHILWWALVHDAPETLTGDMDGKFKRDYPAVKEAMTVAEDTAFPWYAITRKHVVPDWVQALVKVADKVESISFIEMWGLGPRADYIKHELRKILFDDTLPALCDASAGMWHLHSEFAEHIVRDVLHHSVSEIRSIQLRKAVASPESV